MDWSLVHVLLNLLVPLEVIVFSCLYFRARAEIKRLHQYKQWYDQWCEQQRQDAP